MTVRSLLTSLTVASMLFLVMPVRGQIINGSFEVPSVPVGGFTNFAAGSTTITGWTVVGVDSSVVNNTFTQSGITFNAQSGNQWLDLAGVTSNNSNSGVRQVVATVTNQKYALSFYVGSATGGGIFFPATVDLSINGGARVSFFNPTGPSNMLDWKFFTAVFTATGPTTDITFLNGSAANNFISPLDNVTLTAVPEPSSMLLGVLGLGAGAIVMYARRGKRSKSIPSRQRFLANMTLVAAVYLAAGGVVRAQTVLTVPSTANIYGAGHSGAAATPFPGGSSPGPAPSGGTAPPATSVSGGVALTFSATGTIDFGGGTGPHGPEGFSASAFDFASVNGIAGFRNNRASALYGVFTGLTEPADPAPSRLDFVGNTSFTTLSPALNQIFFIGDGLTGTGTGASQQFLAPTGAISLYLGLADGYPVGPNGFSLPGGYNDNTGSFQVQISAVPEVSSILLCVFGLGTCGSVMYLRRKKGLLQEKRLKSKYQTFAPASTP